MLELPRVLVVDADAVQLCDELQRLGLDAQSACDANDALTLLRTDSFDMVLVEMSLPGLSGVGLLRRLHRMGSTVPFVGMCAEPETDDLVQLIRNGAADFLIKPFRPTDVEDALERLPNRAAVAPAPSARQPAPAPAAPAPPASHRTTPVRAAAERPTRSHPGRVPPTRRMVQRAAANERSARPSAPAERPRAARHPSARRLEAQPRAVSTPGSVAPKAPPPLHHEPAPRPNHGKQRHKDPMQDVLLRLQNDEIELPAIAPIANDIQDLLDNPESAVDDVVRVVSQDPSIVAGVIRLANSGRYGTSKGITDLREACLRLGNRRVLALAQQLVIGGLYVLGLEPYGTIVKDLWRNTLVCARGAQQLGEVLEVPDREALFIGAMLHNVGELALLRVLSEIPGRIPDNASGLRELQRVLHGAHEEFGKSILKRWRMPPRFIRIAGGHHSPPSGPEDRRAKQEREIAMLSWAMALREGYLYLPGQDPPDIHPLIESLGISKDDLDSAFRNCRKWVSADGTLNGTAA